MNDILAFLRECLGIFSVFMVFIFNHKSLNEHEQLRVGLFLFINTCGRVFTAPILLFYTLKLSEKLCSKIAPITGCLCSTVTVNSAFTVICPIAIAYSMEQIIKTVCLCVCVSVCVHSHAHIYWWIFTKIGTDVKTPKSKNVFVGGKHRTTLSPFCPQNPILG